MADQVVGGRRGRGRRTGGELGRAVSGARAVLPGPDSGWWLVLAGVAFTAAQLLFVSPRMGLSWDESVYVSQVSGHAPAAWFDPARARGVPLLVAPVAALTGSVVALRVYLSAASSLGLVLALWTWRPLRPAWVLGLAGLAFGGLWVTQYYGPQAMPDMWSAVGCLAAVGCFLHCAGPSRTPALSRRDPSPRTLLRNPPATEEMPSPQTAAASRPRGASLRSRAPRAPRNLRGLAGLGASVAFVTLVRPGDAVYLSVPLLVSVAAVAAWRRWPPAAAIAGGLLAGGAEWVIEAYVRFGGIAARLHQAGAEQGGFGLHFALPDELGALNGPTLCRPCLVGVRDPELDLWWLALPLLVALGVMAARRVGRPGQLSTAVLPAVCGLCLAGQYLFMINYAAPRFLLPAYALFAIPVADALAFLLTGVSWDLRPAMAATVTCFLIAQLFSQHLVLDHEVGGTVTFHDDYTRIATSLGRLGVRPPCLINGVQYIPIAFYLGCASAGNAASAAPGEHVALLIQSGGRPPSYARSWPSYRITGTTMLKVNAYIR